MLRRSSFLLVLLCTRAAYAQDVKEYYDQLQQMGMIDVESGDKNTLTRELDAAEKLLRDGDASDASLALYAIVETPRYDGFHDFVEYQNAEYYLGVALADLGAYDAALDAFDRVLQRGPDAAYWGPAHRRAVDVALETRDHAGVLARLEADDKAEKESIPIPPSAAGERAYLRGRALYDQGDLDGATKELTTVSKKSRLYSSALYLRGVIATRQKSFEDAASAFCEIAATGDNDKFSFVVDDRYFTIKDLARLGLGRIAHENGEYDDAYYHYFQIPEDSQYLPDALFEASWSMYQKRELATSRDLVKEFLDTFPGSPLWPEANLLAGYVELADCKFDDAQKWYDTVAVQLDPVVQELDRIRKDPAARSSLFDRALTRWRDTRAGDNTAAKVRSEDATDQALGLLRLDPDYVRLHDAISGMRHAAGETPGLVKQWAALARRVKTDKVGKIAPDASEEDDAKDADSLAGDFDALADDVARSKQELARGVREHTIDPDDAKEEEKRLDELAGRVDKARAKARKVAEDADADAADQSSGSIRPLIQKDLAAARALDAHAQDLLGKLEVAADNLAKQQVDDLYHATKRVADKAKLGKIDAVIGQKQQLDIDVQDLAQGRFPEELKGRLWDAGMIGDDEEVWPFEGEYWADEYEGWR